MADEMFKVVPMTTVNPKMKNASPETKQSTMGQNVLGTMGSDKSATVSRQTVSRIGKNLGASRVGKSSAGKAMQPTSKQYVDPAADRG